MSTAKPPETSTSPGPKTGRPLVLLVDCDDELRRACGALCERHGFAVVHASDAPEALQEAILLQPRAIVLDLVLPSMPGWELLKRLRADHRTAHVPVLATSGLLASEAERKAQAAGATRYLPKPFDDATLLLHVRELASAY